jgi:hypothetical protein
MSASEPRILFLASDREDYLADSLFLGLRQVLGESVIDAPRRDPLYSNYPPDLRRHRYGHGFTLYGGLLEDVPVDRSWAALRIERGEFDLVVFGDIQSCFGRWVELLHAMRGTPAAVLDGGDYPAMYPFGTRWWRHPRWWLLPRAHRRAMYFKRELTPETRRLRWFMLLPRPLAERLGPPRGLRPIAFSIPDEKIVNGPTEKSELLATHVVDPEVAARAGNSTSAAFSDEAEYYADLQRARFGVTTKRAGWDCMRHYELAANGCVPCFRDLAAKPASCAPHGLDESNCVSYADADDLFAKLDRIDDAQYERLQAGALIWARENSTRNRARQFLSAVGLSADV